ncbi:unnamed protein product [Protopolystoma xenopodis]|uniref:Uncharacterized protein n=1 Tax=Protopolystoma xenopodis TaxID=117903 RepID=A0A3S5A620_9PLAT|nr:unnamed protein product [Protopolystoma xenopodis]
MQLFSVAQSTKQICPANQFLLLLRSWIDSTGASKEPAAPQLTFLHHPILESPRLVCLRAWDKYLSLCHHLYRLPLFYPSLNAAFGRLKTPCCV